MKRQFDAVEENNQRRQPLLTIDYFHNVELIGSQDLLFSAEAYNSGHKVALVWPFGMHSLYVTKKVLPLVGCPAICALIFGNPKKASV
jgi:hypothetical protein